MGELGYKEVIDLDTGQRLGYVRDALVDSETGRVRALIIPGRLRCLGLLGRGPELTLPWESISRLTICSSGGSLPGRAEEKAAADGQKRGKTSISRQKRLANRPGLWYDKLAVGECYSGGRHTSRKARGSTPGTLWGA